MIDKTAVVDPSAKIGAGVTIGAYSVIGPNVEIGDNTWIGSHVVITSNTKIGKNNKIYQFASIGGDNQDLTFDDKPTYLEIGDDNTIHEFVTINRGSIKEAARCTKVGNHNLIMAYVHIGHDSILGSHTILVNGATLAGHVIVNDHAIVGAYCAIHQFCRLGAYSMLSHAAMINKDVLPYVMVAESKPKVFGLNKVGLERNGFSKETIATLLAAYKIIFRSGLQRDAALEQLSVLRADCAEVQALIDGLQCADRGIVR